MRTTRVVVPCYNEARRLAPDAFLRVLADEPSLGFVMVDDGSTDETAAVLGELREKAPDRVELVTLEKNSGKAEAVRRGVLRAFEQGAALTGYWDADLATPLEYIARFAEMLEGDVVLVLGSRVRLLGHEVQRNALRHYVGRVFGTIAALSLGLAVYDTQCGAKLFKANAAMQSAFSERFRLTWSFDVELLSRLLERELEVGDIAVARQCIEYPLGEWVDRAGSKITPAHFPRIAAEVLKLYGMARRARRAARER